MKMHMFQVDLPCASAEQMRIAIWLAVSKSGMSKQMVNLINYAIRSAEFHGVSTECPTVRMFLDDDVRYHLECDQRAGIISIDERNRLERELERFLSTGQ